MPRVLVRKYRMAHFQALVALLVASYSSTGSGHNNLHVASAHINKNISTASDSHWWVIRKFSTRMPITVSTVSILGALRFCGAVIFGSKSSRNKRHTTIRVSQWNGLPVCALWAENTIDWCCRVRVHRWHHWWRRDHRGTARRQTVTLALFTLLAVIVLLSHARLISQVLSQK